MPTATSIKSKKIPASLKNYFWDTDIDSINPKKNWRYIITRLLDLGEKDAYDYLVKQFPKELITKTIKKDRGFTKKSANFWGLYFGIKRNQITCLKKEFPNPPVNVWPY